MSEPQAAPLNYTIPQTCKLLNIKRTKAYDLIKQGHLDAFLIGGRRLVRGDSARKLAEFGTEAA